MQKSETKPPAASVLLQENGNGEAPSLPLSLLDGATPESPLISSEFAGESQIARDMSRSLPERLEAFEDMVESQVGDTSLSRARNIERELGIKQLYLKFDGGNPTGTQKDRIAFAQAIDALRRGFDAVTVATCGNYGVAMTLATSLAGLRCYIYIPEGYRTRRLTEMQQPGVEIIRVPGDYENAVQCSRERSDADDIYDANPGGANTAIQLHAYGEIAYEIYDDLRDAPAAVAVPVSNGTTLSGIYRGFVSLYRRGKTSRIPRMIAGSSYNKNPIIHAVRKGLPSCANLQPERIRETQINEPLINWHSIDGQQALDAIRDSGGWAEYASDKSMLTYSKALREREGLNVLPASTAGLIALLDRHRSEPLSNDRYVVVLTGKK